MRITSATMYSGDTELASFALGLGETPDRYLIKAMSGVDAAAITPRFYSMGLESGQGLFDFGLTAREIVFRIGLNPKLLLDESFSELRDRLYRAISANRNGTIRIQFNSGAAVIAHIYGFITKFEASLFTKSPEAQITVRCDDPFFRGIAPVTMASPDDFTTDNPIIVPDSLSTAPHGFLFEIEFTSSADAITIQETLLAPEWVFTVTPSGGFGAGDVLKISSEERNKYVTVNSGGGDDPVVDGISVGSVWPILFPGENRFYLSEMPSVADVSVSFYPAYWGI